MKQPFVPRNEILHYCEHIMNAHIQTLRKNKKTKTWFWDYPAMAAICHDKGCTLKRASFSHYPYRNEYHPILERKLLELGDIGGTCTKVGRRFIIGNCAEQHAANLFMKHYCENDLSHLFFSQAMRPRTKQVFDYCDNCKDTFPNL